MDRIDVKLTPYLNRITIHKPNVRILHYMSPRVAAHYHLLLDKLDLNSKHATRKEYKGAISHESFHAQVYGTSIDEVMRHLYSELPVGYTKYLDESLANVVTYEILARMALEGDKLAKINLGIRLLYNFTVNRMKPEDRALPRNQAYFIVPLNVAIDAASCKLSEYKDIKLPATRKFIQQAVLN